MKNISILNVFLLLVFSACSTLPTPAATQTPQSTQTLKFQPTTTASPTSPGYPQITLGLTYSALNKKGCGGIAVYSMDYDKSQGKAINYWQEFPEIPKPKGLSYSTRDGRRALDYCTKVRFPITWQMEEGMVTQNRINDGVLDILITKGVGKGLTLTHGHVNPDIDPQTPGIQLLEVGTIVLPGDLIAYTGRSGIPAGSDASTQNGLLDDKGYIPSQELMLIGEDGQPNILYEK